MMLGKICLELNHYLYQCRIDNKITQRYIAKKLQLGSAQYISNIERGYCNPSHKVIKFYIKECGADKLRIIKILQNFISKAI